MDPLSVVVLATRIFIPRFAIGLALGIAAAGCVSALILGSTPVRAVAGVALGVATVFAVRVLRRWLSGQRSSKLLLHIDSDAIELSQPSSQESARLIAEFLRRHAPSAEREGQVEDEPASSPAPQPAPSTSVWQQMFAEMPLADQERVVTEFLQRHSVKAEIETTADSGAVTGGLRDVPYWLRVTSPLIGIVTGVGGMIIAVLNSR